MKPRFTRKTTLVQLAGAVSGHLAKRGITAVLTGGAVVSIYTTNAYQSFDLDFVSEADLSILRREMEALGFHQEAGRHFVHPDCPFYVEFPPPPLAIGNLHLTTHAIRHTRHGKLHLLNPTQCVMDRLAAWYHWEDRPSLEQALMVARRKRVRLNEIRKWSAGEGKTESFEEFLRLLKQAMV